MFSIGEFSRHARISVRMLRHYDAIGLLRPAYVDPASGYRFYQAGQLSDLNRIIARQAASWYMPRSRWTDANSFSSVGYPREVTIEWWPDTEKWVTELQQPVRPAHALTSQPDRRIANVHDT